LIVGVLVGCGGLAVGGCSTPPAIPLPGTTGSLFNLQVGDGGTLDTVTYQIVGPGNYTQQGTLPVGDSPTLTATFAAVPPGVGYTVRASGTASDGVTLCSGQTTFDVPESTTVTLDILLTCGEPPSGSVQVSGALNVCPIIDSVAAAPSEVRVGNTIVMTLAARDPDSGPMALQALWSASAGVLSNTSTTGATFTCAIAGPVMIEVQVSDGDATAGCPDTSSLNLNCSAAVP
jgi:hypothetical protein